jgi:lysylphosphatidylglycerol synthetase-like protein (DUF2156 family)
MVNSVVDATPVSSTPITILVRVYVGIVVATLAALTVLSVAGSPEASEEAWIHAVIVSGFAVLLPLRARAAQQKAQALTALGVMVVRARRYRAGGRA